MAAASYRWLEKPFLQLKERFKYLRTPEPGLSSASPPPGYLLHSDPTLTSRNHTATASTTKQRPRATRKRANRRMSHDDLPRALYVLSVAHAAPPTRIKPATNFSICIATARA